MVSSSPDRSNFKEVSASTLSGKVYIFVQAVPKTTEIAFYFDSSTTPVAVEHSAPWDLATTAKGGAARPFDIDGLGVGKHTIRYRMTYNGQSVVNTATFTVGSATPTEPEPVPTTPKPVDTTAPTKPVTTPTPTPSATATDPAPPVVPPVSDGGVPTPTNLDATGRTIPDTNYAIPSGAVFMATNGSDSAAGTKAAPVKTLNRAVALAPEGGTIVVRAGTYRDWYSKGGTVGIVTKSLTFQAYPHEQVWFSGTDVVPASQFRSDGNGHWYMTWETPTFCMGHYYTRPLKSPSKTPKNDQCAYWDSSLDSQNPLAVDPQMVFADGKYIREVGSLAQAKGDNFYYAQDTAKKTGKLYLGFNPADRSVEVTARSTALVLKGKNSKVLGLGFQRYASNVLGSTSTGAVYNQSIGALFENTAFVQNAGPGYSGSLQETTVRHSLFVKNGANGIVSNGHMRSGAKDDALIENSLFNGNNAERFDVGCSASCGAANIKLNHMVGFTVRNNIIENSGGTSSGVWCDLACTKGVIVNNVVSGNGGHGIFYEVSDTGIIASNLVSENSGRGIQIASANTKVYNNTLVGHLLSFNIYDDQRSYGVSGWTDVGPNTSKLQIANNVVVGTNNQINCGPPAKAGKNQAPNTGCSQFFSMLDYNSYYQTAESGSVSFKFANIGQTNPTLYKSLGAFRSATGLDAHSSGTVSTGGPDPVVVSGSGSKVSIQAQGEDVTEGPAATIPADVAEALGLSKTSGLGRGAITWPGK